MSKGILLGDKFPDFQAETNEGFISSFYDWIGKEYVIFTCSLVIGLEMIEKHVKYIYEEHHILFLFTEFFVNIFYGSAK